MALWQPAHSTSVRLTKSETERLNPASMVCCQVFVELGMTKPKWKFHSSNRVLSHKDHVDWTIIGPPVFQISLFQRFAFENYLSSIQLSAFIQAFPPTIASESHRLYQSQAGHHFQGGKIQLPGHLQKRSIIKTTHFFPLRGIQTLFLHMACLHFRISLGICA